MTSTLNNYSSTNKMECWKMDCWNVSKASSWLFAHRWLIPQKLWSSCQQEFFKTEETNVQGNKYFHILIMCSNYAINISVIIGSIMAASTKTLQFISVTFLKIIFKRHSGKDGLWTHSLDLRLWAPGRLNSGYLDSTSLGAWTLDALTLDAWTLGCLDFGRLDSGRLGS